MKKLFMAIFTALLLSAFLGISYAEDLRIDGSTTVLPIAQKAAEVFMRKYPDVRIYVSGSGSGTGIKALIDGTTNIATSSREAKDKETSAGKEKKITLTAHKVALDGIVS